MVQGLMETALLWKGLGWLCSLAIAVLFLALLFPRPDQPAQKEQPPDEDAREQTALTETSTSKSGAPRR
jgi:hypothetical protein